ncbi:glutathione peroxidase [Formosa sp. S-31]|uniref:glutathione peroxidase n=1 Tax=Formosa sp. S-31 TaxID=2790949 RepID=UPI003EB9F3A7
MRDCNSIYDIPLKDLSGQPIDLGRYKGKYLLIVNTASKCGFTGQYQDLEALYKQYQDKLMVIGTPCNQFGQQEPGTAPEITSFCERNYGVSFVMSEKLKVKGEEQHPLYAWLTKKECNGSKNSTVRWNFQKYLINPEGQIIDYYYSITKPLSIKITKHLK